MRTPRGARQALEGRASHPYNAAMQASAGATPNASTAISAPDALTGLARRERVRAFDLARGLAVLDMILVHILWHWGQPATWASPVGQVIGFIGGPTGPPMFMFLMGASLAFSSRSSTRNLILRGLWLVWLGYLLNVLRGVLPAGIGLTTGYVTQEQIAPFTPWWLLTTVDVHQMAGFALVAIAGLTVVARPGWIWLAVAVVVALVAPFVRGISFGTPLLDIPLTPVWGDAENVYYAVFPWLVYPLVGVVFGSILARSADKAATFRKGGLVGAAMAALGGVLILATGPSLDVTSFFREPPALILVILGIGLAWLWACDVIVRHVRENRVFNVVYGWSARVIGMYFIHWIIVGWGVGVVGLRSLELVPALIGTIVTLVLTHYLSIPRGRFDVMGWLHAPLVRLESRERPPDALARPA